MTAQSQFYDTIGVDAHTHKKYEQKNGTQNDQILALFKRWPRDDFNAERIRRGYYMAYFKELDPSSCRRAITQLYQSGKINRVRQVVSEKTGKKVWSYQYNANA